MLFFVTAAMLLISVKGFAAEQTLESEAAVMKNVDSESVENIQTVNEGSWETSGKYTSWVFSDGSKATGWKKISGKVYYFDKDGSMVKGPAKIGGAWYFFNKQGVRKSGWVRIRGYKYYFDKSCYSQRAQGWKKIGKNKYYFKKNGKYAVGWMDLDGKRYYFLSDGRMANGWKVIGGKKYYFKKNGEMVSGETSIRKSSYYFGEDGTLSRLSFTSDGRFTDSTGRILHKSTIKQLLKIALMPVGSTMYVWGGGWGSAYSGGDISARSIGVSPQWKAFYKQQNSSYDYRTTRYQTKNGLDCSGYVGWVIYNAFNKTSGNGGFVMLAEVMASTYARYGWGSYTPASLVTNFKAGDIMSTASGHVYIVVGECPDTSVVLLHSSPTGVMLTGTATRSGNTDSTAVKLAEKYMSKYYPDWYSKFPKVSRGTSYLTSYAQMRWYISTKNSMMSDPEGYRNKNASQVLRNLFR